MLDKFFFSCIKWVTLSFVFSYAWWCFASCCFRFRFIARLPVSNVRTFLFSGSYCNTVKQVVFKESSYLRRVLSTWVFLNKLWWNFSSCFNSDLQLSIAWLKFSKRNQQEIRKTIKFELSIFRIFHDEIQVVFLKESFFYLRIFLVRNKTSKRTSLMKFFFFLHEPLPSNNFHGILLILLNLMDLVDTTISAFTENLQDFEISQRHCRDRK